MILRKRLPSVGYLCNLVQVLEKIYAPNSESLF